jgi:stringent starvation protein B
MIGRDKARASGLILEKTTEMSLSFSDAAKAKTLREYFSRHGRIYIVVDATRDDVLLPDNLKGDPALRLVLNSRMPQPILIRDDRLDSDFSFSGTVYSCQIPMHTIWAAYLPDGNLEQGIIWDDDVPELVKAIVKAVRSNMPDKDETTNVEQDDAGNAPNASEKQNSAAATSISVIDGGAATDNKNKRSKRKTSHLRVVK